ncbi:histone acetyltransferase type B catalytic subunit [Amylocystis lapponica]|nr:histone acetyltransferase type B catalytic subunit [Amylocystis lapponica]
MSPTTNDYTADANEALRLSLVRAKDDKASLTLREAYEGFHPTFTYPIFGEHEQIYGYSNLVVDLKFASGSLAQYLHVSYADTLPSTSTVDDIEGVLGKRIPPDYYTDEADFIARVEADAIAFRPPGKRISHYLRPARLPSRKGKNVAISRVLSPEDEEIVEFEVYHSTWDTPGFRDYHRRMQLFILLYIEAGSYINEAEDTWEFVVLYEKRKRRSDPDVATYHFVGYSTLYPFYCFPEKVRMRLSQFVILPPYQQEGHGSALYNAIYQYVLTVPHIAELTVEDPAEAFEDLRDRNDLKMLLAHERFMREGLGDAYAGSGGSGGDLLGHAHGILSNGVGSNGGGKVMKTKRRAHAHAPGHAQSGRLGPPAERTWLEKWRIDLKLASRQFNRLVEMLMLKHLDQADTRAVKAYRLQVKERLYRFNYEVLMQLDKQERQHKLEETFQGVRDDYRRILALVY